MKAKILACASLLMACLICSGRLSAGNIRYGLSTNVLEWANFGTVNLEAGFGVTQHLSIQAGALYNPWNYTIKGTDHQMFNHQTSAFAGVRWWPWYVFSGWWFGAKAKYSYATRTGIWRPALEDRQSVGIGLSIGYSLMLSPRLNLELGAGIWGGTHFKYSLYDCANCMMLRESGAKGFIGIDTLSISLMYVF